MKKLLLLFGILSCWVTAQGQYCTTGLYTSGCGFGDDIDDFTLGSFSDLATGCTGTGAYNDYTSQTIVVTQTLPQVLTVTSNFSNQTLRLFIDYNSDQDFDDPGEEIYVSPGTFGNTTSLNDTLTLPAGGPVGTFRMRVRAVYASPLFTACSQHSYGEVHDYTIQVKPNTAGNCANSFSNFAIDSVTAYGAKINWIPGTGNSSYFIEYGTAGFTPGTGTTLTGTYPASQPPVILSGLTPVTAYDVYFGEICNSGADSVYFAQAQQFTTTVTCPAPTMLADSGTTGNSASIVWKTVSGTDFLVEWGPVGFQQGTGSTATVSNDTNYTITGLNPLSMYDIYIADSCSSTDISTYTGPLTVTTGCNGALSGTYTLDPGQVFSATNFTSFDQLGLAFELCGVSGPVVVNVAGGSVFNEQIEFGAIAGASATNTITINGNGAELSYLSTDMNNRATLTLMGTDYLTIDSLTVRALGSATGEYGMTIRLTDDADYNTIRNCMLVGDTSSTSSNFSNFAINGVGSTWPTSTNGASGDYNLVENNTIIGGYYGLISTGQWSDSANGNVLRNNTIRDFRYYGLYAYYNNGMSIDGNDISRPNRTNLTTFYGLYMYSFGSGEVINNRIHDPMAQDTSILSAAYGMYMGQFNGTSSNRSLVANNMIYNFQSNGTQYGFYGSSGSNTDYLHNTVIFNNPMSSSTYTTRAVYLLGTYDNANFKNNLIYLDRSGTANNTVFYFSGTLTPTSEFDNNGYYATPASSADFYFGGSQASFSMWQSASEQDSNSYFVNPFLTDVANGDFTPQSSVLDGLGEDFTAMVAMDIDGNVRTSPVDPGAMEFTGAACTGPNGLTVSSVGVTNATISWKTNTTPFTIEWGPVGFKQASITPNVINVPSGDTSAAMTGMSAVTCYDYYVIQNCNSSIPGAPPVIGPLQICTGCATAGLNGTYTIGGTPGPNNFATLDSAVSVLNSCGILGPVVFNMNGGTHSPIILENVSGSSATNTITFNGSLSGDTIMGTGATAAVEFDGARFVTFDNFHMENQAGNYVVWLHDLADHVTISNSELVGSRTTTTFSTAVVAASNSATSPSSSGLNAEHFSLDNCKIIGNYYGVTAYGTSSTSYSNGFSVTNCNFEDQYYYGIRANYIDSLMIEGNHIGEFRNTFSYGIYCYYNGMIDVRSNTVEKAGTYAMYSYYTNINTGSATKVSTIANNMLNSDGSYGLYSYGNNFTNIYHNTMDGSSYGLYLSGSSFNQHSNLDVRNNLITNEGTGPAIYIGTEPDTNFTVDYNAYHTNGTTLANAGGTHATLAAWQAADSTKNANSVSGDPMYVSPTNLHVLGAVANDAGDNSVGILVDIDGDVRPASGSTTVDIGADEYTPVSDDIAMINGEFVKNGRCLTAMDTVMLQVQNVIGSTKDFSVTPLTATYNVTGPVNTTGTITVNSGTLASMDTLDLMAMPIDLSVPGVYTLNAYISPSSTNLSALNDTLMAKAQITIYSNWEVNPDTVVIISNMTDTVELEAKSPLFGGADFFITEICHFKTTSGAPTNGWPTYLTADDYLEITGVPGSDLGGFTLEQWGTSSMNGTVTFPQGTVMGPNGTAIIMLGQGATTSDPNNFLYDGRGGSTNTYSSGTAAGRILKDASGNIVDAVGYAGGSSYTFPTAAGVTSADWSGNPPTSSGTCGIRLEGADVNSATNWVASATSPQDPNMVNQNVQVPTPGSVQGFSWSLNGTVIDTLPTTVVGPYTVGGVYNYIATYNSPCGVFSDTVTVIVNLPGFCATPTNLSGTAIACDSIRFDWQTASDSALVSYVVSGGTPGTGNLVIGDSSYTVVGVTANTDYDFYVANICGGDTSAVAGPFTLNSGSAGAPMADFTASPVMSSLQVDFDASASMGARATYTWDFGDGNNGSGMMTSHTYAAGGDYTVTLTVTNACGTHDTTYTVAGVSLVENSLAQQLRMFPNPAHDELHLVLGHADRGGITIRVMDLSGKEVIRLQEEKTTEKLETILNVSTLAKGVYMIEVSAANNVAVRRFIKD